jgi:hypothetical protein
MRQNIRVMRLSIRNKKLSRTCRQHEAALNKLREVYTELAIVVQIIFALQRVKSSSAKRFTRDELLMLSAV